MSAGPLAQAAAWPCLILQSASGNGWVLGRLDATFHNLSTSALLGSFFIISELNIKAYWVVDERLNRVKQLITPHVS